MITTSDAVVVQLAGQAGGPFAWQWLSATPASIQSGIINGLRQWFRVQAFDMNAPTDYAGTFNYTATIRVVSTSGDYGSAEDIAAVVASVAYDVTAWSPTATVADVIVGGANDGTVPTPTPGGNDPLSLASIGWLLAGGIVLLALVPRAARSVGL